MKKPDPLPSRQNPRLKGYDYSQAGAYFVTICAHNREMLFGEISEDEMRCNEFGAMVAECWAAIPQHFPGVELVDFVVMPNHVHGILVIHDEDEGRACPAPTSDRRSEKPVSLLTVVGSFKAAAARRINTLRRSPGRSTWQRSFYERIIRDEDELIRIQHYMADNPLKWSTDRENPGSRRRV